MPQTVFPQQLVQREGALARGPYDAESYAAEGALAVGLLLDFGTDPDRQVRAMPALPAADVDAIMTAAQFASTVAGQSYSTAVHFDGAIGHDRISPAATISVTFAAANINDWNTPAGECLVEIYGLDEDGNSIKDSISRPNGAATATYSTRLAFSAVHRIDTPACNGATGTGTVGFSLDRVALGRADYPGIAIYDPAKEPNTALLEVADEDQISVLTAGKFWAVTEHAVTNGDDVYVRVVLAALDVRGQFTGQDGAAVPATYAHLSNARWRSDAAADGLAIIELKG